MQRVLIVGSPGSGKSTLARRLAVVAGLPVVHLDQAYWRPGWVEPEKAEWRERLAEVLAGPEWILDGHYGGTLEQRLAAADTVVFLDLPTWVCVGRTLKRVVLGRGRRRADMAEGCVERLDLSFLMYVLWFRRAKRGGVMARLEGFSGEVVVLRSRAEVQGWMDLVCGAEASG